MSREYRWFVRYRADTPALPMYNTPVLQESSLDYEGTKVWHDVKMVYEDWADAELRIKAWNESNEKRIKNEQDSKGSVSG